MWAWLSQAGTWLVSEGKVFTFYAESLRSDLFNGFLALAGFMLAAKTFIVIHMKQEVYGKEEYGKRFYERRELVGESKATRYGSLRRMSDALYWIVVSSVVAALSQFTVGLVPWSLAALLCLGTAVFAIWKLVQGLCLMKENLNSWFDMIDDEENERIGKNNGESAAGSSKPESQQ